MSLENTRKQQAGSGRETDPPDTHPHTAKFYNPATAHAQAMDSMRNLSTSLPRRRTDQPQDLLSDFRAAALSVTNLYKTAASAQVKARAAGYQDALDDILAFLDKENLGLMDGEGWRVRRWATERLDGDGIPVGQRQAPVGSDDDEDGGSKEEEERRSSTPEVQRKGAVPEQASSELGEESPPQTRVSESPPIQQQQQQQQQVAQTPEPAVPSSNDFTFRSTHVYPSNHDRIEATSQANGMDLDTSTTPTTTTSSSAATTPSSAEPLQRTHLRPSRNRHNRQRGGTTGTVNFNLGAGAGGKRKMPYPDFFDISGINFEGQDRRDGSGGGGGGRGGGKRGRFV